MIKICRNLNKFKILTEFVKISPNFDHLSSLAPPEPNFAKGLNPDFESVKSPLQDLISSFPSYPWGRGQNSRFVQKVRNLVLKVPKLKKKSAQNILT